MTSTPIITVAYDLDEGVHQIYATSYSRTEVAGPRLFRAPPHPDIRFQHASQEAADRDAQILREYLSRVTSGPKKARGREEAEVILAPTAETVNVSDAWWLK